MEESVVWNTSSSVHNELFNIEDLLSDSGVDSPCSNTAGKESPIRRESSEGQEITTNLQQTIVYDLQSQPSMDNQNLPVIIMDHMNGGNSTSDDKIGFTISYEGSPDDGEVKVHLDHVFRHGKELKQATHGGYLDGSIKLPSNLLGNPDFVVRITPDPATTSEMKIQPNLFHLTVMNSTRKTEYKSELNERSWELLLRIRDGGRARSFVIWDPERKEYFEKSIPNQCVQNGHIKLGGINGILMTIITPLQSGNRGEQNGVRIFDVIKDRIEREAASGRYGHLTVRDVQNLTTKFTDKKANQYAKIEMHRCRLRVDFLDGETRSTSIAQPVYSGNIFNSKNNDVGALELHDMSDPRGCCVEGGYKVLLSSEFKTPTHKKHEDVPIRAVFVVENGPECVLAEIALPGFNQISIAKESFQIHQNTIAFIVPKQNPELIRSLGQSGQVLKVALYRPHDGRFSTTKYAFNYTEHGPGFCAFCAVMGRNTQNGASTPSTSSMRPYIPARRDWKRRTTKIADGEKKVGNSSKKRIPSNLLEPPSPSGSMTSYTSGVYSPASNCQEWDAWSPAPKSRRRSEEDIQVPVMVEPEGQVIEEHNHHLQHQQPPPPQQQQQLFVVNNVNLSPYRVDDGGQPMAQPVNVSPRSMPSNGNVEAVTLTTLDTFDVGQYLKTFDTNNDVMDCSRKTSVSMSEDIEELEKGFSKLSLPTDAFLDDFLEDAEEEKKKEEQSIEKDGPKQEVKRVECTFKKALKSKWTLAVTAGAVVGIAFEISRLIK